MKIKEGIYKNRLGDIVEIKKQGKPDEDIDVYPFNVFKMEFKLLQLRMMGKVLCGILSQIIMI